MGHGPRLSVWVHDETEAYGTNRSKGSRTFGTAAPGPFPNSDEPRGEEGTAA